MVQRNLEEAGRPPPEMERKGGCPPRPLPTLGEGGSVSAVGGGLPPEPIPAPLCRHRLGPCTPALV